MSTFVVAVFAVTYFGMALGRLPGSRVDRTGIAMIAAVALVALGAESPARAAASIDFPTLLLLAGMMVLSARFGAAGLYDAAAAWIAQRAARPILLLALTVAVGGVLSALLVNDIVVFAMAPILCRALVRRGADARPYLYALAASSNAGSAATLVGNPQNILIGQAGHLGFWPYAAVATPVALASLVAVFATVAITWRRELATAPPPAPVEPVTVHAEQAWLCAAGLVALLALFATPVPREISALAVAAGLVVSRTMASRIFFDRIDWPLLILFAGLFVVNDALTGTGLAVHAVDALAAHGIVPTRALTLGPLALVLSNTIGNVPAVIMILELFPALPPGVLAALAVLSTLAGNLLLVGSLANLITAERAAGEGVRLTFRDHARAGVPLTLATLAMAALWLVALGAVRP